MSAKAETKVANEAEEHTDSPKTSGTPSDPAAVKDASSDETSKHNPKTEDSNPESSEKEKVKDSDKSDDSSDKKNKKEDVNSDGFVPGTPLSKNHPDSTAAARREAKEHHAKEEQDISHKGSTKEHEGIGAKLKHALHHDKKEA